MHSFSHAQECTTDGAINVPGLYYSVVRLNETTRQNSCFEVCVRDGNWTGICPKSLFVGMNRLANSSCAMRNYTTQVDSYDKNLGSHAVLSSQSRDGNRPELTASHIQFSAAKLW